MGRALELAQQANAARRAGRLPDAAFLYARARAALPDRVEDLQGAEVDALEASLDRDLLHLGDALDRLGRARRVFRLHRREEDIVRCDLKRAQILCDLGDHRRAQKLFAEVMRRLPPRHRMRGAAGVGIARAELDLGNTGAARELFDLLVPVFGAVVALDGDPLGHLPRLSWLEAELLLAEDRLIDARRILTTLSNRYCSEGNPFDSALVLIDLAECAERMGRVDEVGAAAVAMSQLFARLQMTGAAETASKLILHRIAQRQGSEAVVRLVLEARRCSP